MSGIFDKYLNMINGSKNTFGQMHTRTNTSASVTTINSREAYIPYQKRRTSSTASSMSEGDASSINELRKSSMASIGEPGAVAIETEIKEVKRLSEPNNRVNF